jgi:hypothetical protein
MKEMMMARAMMRMGTTGHWLLEGDERHVVVASRKMVRVDYIMKRKKEGRQ